MQAFARSLKVPYEKEYNMLNRILMGAAVLSLAAGTLPAPAQAADAALSPCLGCHDVSSDKKKLVGPPLFGVYGSKPVTAGIPFGKWDQASLDTWIKDPSKVKAATLMTYATGNPKKRGEIIKALQSLK